MKFQRKKAILKFSLLVLSILIIISVGISVYFILNKNSSESREEFQNFMNLYISKNIDEANFYILDTPIPNINEIFSNAINNSNNPEENEIISTFEQMFYSIDYNIISSKTFLNQSTLNINFNYYDLAKHTINLFKDSNENENMNYENLINSLKSIKNKTSITINVELKKKNNKWNIVLSEKLLNILTSGIYKKFVI